MKEMDCFVFYGLAAVGPVLDPRRWASAGRNWAGAFLIWSAAVGSGCGRAFCVCGVWVGACVCVGVVRLWWRMPARPLRQNARPHPLPTAALHTQNAPAQFLPALAQSRGSETGPTAATELV